MIREAAFAGILFAASPVNVITGPPAVFVDSRSTECLAMNMYHEARNQGSAGLTRSISCCSE